MTVIPIHIFILCYNEAVLLPHTIAHYRKYLPSASITIYDNESTDNSVEIATALGCSVVSFSSHNIQNEYVQQAVRNNCWSNIRTGWILTLDMDEWLCITEQDLHAEMVSGTSIISVKGFNMIGNSKSELIDDIDLHAITRGVYHPAENKPLCFLRDKIDAMEFTVGGHYCKPAGQIKYSDATYINKHMYILGLPFLINRMRLRYERTHVMRAHGMDGHYTAEVDKITHMYTENREKAAPVDV